VEKINSAPPVNRNPTPVLFIP